ncbi:site-2 protease family protein [Plantactinospora sp. B5E13]|uniref:site-2 protease family protein n=1 Tax=unclassified Plantactinospora TaxID=2631981 RepID=UPI00325D40A8
MFGVPVQVNASMLLLAAVITLMYGGVVQRQLDLSRPAGYLFGAGFVILLLGSVLLHELGHALTARRYGIGVRGITLELLGGYTEMDRDAPTPRVDLLVSLAGPAVSLVIGLAATGLTLALPDGTLVHQFAFQLAASNLLVALFNSLPGLPLDGGRALRAGVWAATRDQHLATEVAGWSGRLVAVGTVALVLLLTWVDVLPAQGVGPVLGLALVLVVAVTLWQGAGQAIRAARISRRFPLIDLARLARPVFRVPTGTPLAEAQRRGAAAGAPEPALGVVDSSGRLVAVVDRATAAAVPVERRPWVAVDTVARGLDRVPTLSVRLVGEEVVHAVQSHPGAQYLVTSGEDVVGVLHVADLAQLLEPNRKMTQ